MILLRVLAFVVGSLMVLLAPQFSVGLMAEIRGQYVPVNLTTVVTGMSAIAVIVSGFFVVGVFGHAMGRKLWLRVLTGVLLGVTFVASGAALLMSERIAVIAGAGPLLCFTCVLFAAFVFPGMKKGSRRPMRPRDYGNEEKPADFAPTQH